MIGPDTWKMKQLGGTMPLYEHRYKYGKQKSIMSVEEFKARAHQDDFDETFNVTLYLNNTSIGAQTVNLTSGRILMLNFGLNITAFDCGNCSISAYAAPVQYETTTTDSMLVEGFGQS
jgi:hypothetical protein